MYEELQKLKELLDAGIITQQDFYLKKAEILRGVASIGDLAGLAELKNAGILTEEEFFLKKTQALSSTAGQPAASGQMAQPVAMAPVEEGSTTGWAVLGFFIPLVGLILFLAWKDSKPKASKASGKGALIGFIVGLVVSVLSYGLLAAVFASSYYW